MREFNDEAFTDREAFKNYLKLYRLRAKEFIERYDQWMNSEINSADDRIHGGVLRERLYPSLQEFGDVVYSAILRFNEGNNPMGLTREDVQEAQLVQDEVVEMLRKAGVNVNFQRDGPRPSS